MDALTMFHMGSGFCKRLETLTIEEMIPYQERALYDEIEGAEKSHAIENFRLAAQVMETGRCDDEFYGMVFQDSDVAKWLEAAAYSLLHRPDERLLGRVRDVVTLIGRAQQPDGYLNTYFTVKEPGKRWSNLREAHELYCAGHMIEAAVALCGMRRRNGAFAYHVPHGRSYDRPLSRGKRGRVPRPPRGGARAVPPVPLHGRTAGI